MSSALEISCLGCFIRNEKIPADDAAVSIIAMILVESFPMNWREELCPEHEASLCKAIELNKAEAPS